MFLLVGKGWHPPFQQGGAAQLPVCDPFSLSCHKQWLQIEEFHWSQLGCTLLQMIRPLQFNLLRWKSSVVILSTLDPTHWTIVDCSIECWLALAWELAWWLAWGSYHEFHTWAPSLQALLAMAKPGECLWGCKAGSWTHSHRYPAWPAKCYGLKSISPAKLCQLEAWGCV